MMKSKKEVKKMTQIKKKRRMNELISNKLINYNSRKFKMKNLAKNVVLSGIQPSGFIHLGNYLGAVQNWV